ncbi:ROK family protein [Clostridium sp.]|uniref:ROK family protein n=1 Tax=Clostridium sp. TaxID=1506 RepID=UPI0025BCEFEE|nr:ROK family protein [Clostridium sp.]
MAYLGIDIGGTFIKYGIVDSKEIINKGKVLTPKDNYDNFIKEIKNIILENCSDIKGIGISVPGKVNSKTGLIQHGGALAYLHNKNLKDEIKRIIDLPIYIENDGKAATLAEHLYGNLKGVNNGGAIILGTGVGSGYILDGVLRRGEHFQSGEISFIVQDNKLQGEQSFVAYKASAVLLINELANILGVEPDGREVFSIIAKSPDALIRLNNYSKNIALLIYNIQAILDLDCYVIGGGISAQSLLIESINKAYDDIYNASSIISETLSRPRIIQAKYREDANLIGATWNLKEEK